MITVQEARRRGAKLRSDDNPFWWIVAYQLELAAVVGPVTVAMTFVAATAEWGPGWGLLAAVAVVVYIAGDFSGWCRRPSR